MKVRGASLAGTGQTMQDTWGQADNVCWVLDGAARASRDENGLVACWVDQLSDQLAALASGYADKLLAKLLAHAIEAARLPSAPFHPAATVALARMSQPGLEVLVLGDAAVLAPAEDGQYTLFQDRRLDDVATKVRDQRRQARKVGDDHSYRQLTEELLAEEDRMRNTPGGFWVASNLPEAAHRAQYTRLPGVTRAILMSDGVANALSGAHLSKAAAWTLLWEDTGQALTQLREDALGSDGRVDDLTAVSIQRPSMNLV